MQNRQFLFSKGKHFDCLCYLKNSPEDKFSSDALVVIIMNLSKTLTYIYELLYEVYLVTKAI